MIAGGLSAGGAKWAEVAAERDAAAVRAALAEPAVVAALKGVTLAVDVDPQ